MDKYEKVKKIGEGSFGKAVLVKAKKDGHQYVIKEVSISGMSDKERQESRKEVSVLANMSHPNIVQYKESFEEGGCLYIVMDYCEGGDLFKKINSQKGMLFTEEQILDWFVQICLALKHIHDRKILHRDIKSQNIFLTKDGTVQLGDFGIARVLNSTVELARTCIGTPYYLSPEICENKPYNNKSDIWALGCVLYEMCTLKHAFEAGNMKNLVLKIIRGSYHPVSVHYSQELRSLLAQLFKHNPRERPSVKTILDKPFLSCRIQRFLTPKVIVQEFHHAFIRKQHKVHQGSIAKRPAHGSIPSSAVKITTPACKYGVLLTARKVLGTKKPADRKPAIKHKPPMLYAQAPAAIHRRASQGEEERLKQQEIIKKRRMELIDKEKKQREQMFLLKAEQMKRYEKEKVSRINHAREQGWKNDLISTIGSPERKEYLTRLRQIRLQNFNERQQIKARLRGEKYDSDGSDSQESTEEAELRRKKLLAFKAQANARAAVLKEKLEKKRREANEMEKKAWDDHIASQEDQVCMAAVSTTSQPTTVNTSVLPESESTTPVISMTVALKNVGAITPLKENLPGTDAVIVTQSEKKQILSRLNQNLKSQSPVDEVVGLTLAAPKEENPDSQQKLPDIDNLPCIEERKKWDPAELPVLPTSQPNLEFCATASMSPGDCPPSGGDRKKWEEGLPFVLSLAQQTLEETCIPTKEQTVGEVIQMGVLQDEGQRKLWGVSPDCQVLKVLHEAEVQPLTQPFETVSIFEEPFPIPDKPNQIVAEHAMSTSEEDMSAKDKTLAIIEVEVQTDYFAITGVLHLENASEMEGHTQPSSIAEAQEDVESVVLEDVPKSSHTSVGLHHAWEKQDQQPLLLEVNTNQGAAAAENEGEGERSSQGDKPLFGKLFSPAHRRTSALALLSAQSSVDESSSSLASRSRSVSPLRSKQHNALLIGLSTGLFDANNPKMLRTCSLPDLSRVFSSEQESVIITEDITAPDGNLENEDQDEAKDDDQSETEDAYEDEDLRDIRASMERLLQEESDLMRKLPHDGRGDFNENATVEKDKDLFNRIIVGLEQDNNQMAVGDDDDDGDNEECSNGSPVDEEARELLSNGVGEENHTHKSQLNEEWQSDNSEEDQEGESELYDSIYSRLEEHRFNLEQQMGFEKFIEAYNKIKAIRDDEDDNIDLGSSLALSILGNEHQHLYPNILHLVMADGAYQEGNDKCLEQWSCWQP
ncbi:serine/threonine-protein kinase Nek1 isoform X17 [Vanacampus margaritifer]